MKSGEVIKPDFLIIGAKKCGTSWLWRMLKQHPGTDLRVEKEPFFFGSSEIYRKGTDWYYSLFNHLDPSKVVGEGSTVYLYDNVTYFYNQENILKIDHSLPTIPELVTNELPDIKIFVMLRDPVKRALSDYNHWMRKGIYPPFLGVKELAERRPKTRLVELGHYTRFIKLWKEFVPPERMCIFIFEQDVLASAEETVKDAYRFLNLDSEFKPDGLRRPANRGWGWTRILLNYYAGRSAKKLSRKRPVNWIFDGLDRLDLLKRFAIKEEDIEYLRSIYLAEKEELENLIGRNLNCWNYDR